MEKLYKKDVQILRYIKRKNPTREAIVKRFRFEVPLRVLKLQENNLIDFDDEKDTWNHIIKPGKAYITNDGIVALENQSDENFHEFLSALRNGVVFPAIVSFITSLITALITVMLSTM